MPWLIGLCLGAAFGNVSYGTALISTVNATELNDQTLKNWIEADTSRPFSGVAMIAQNGKVLARYHSKGIPVEGQFVIASITKQMTAALVLAHANQNNWSLSDSAQQWAEGLPAYQTSVTLAGLLNHSSGVIAPERPIYPAKPATFRYSNWGYDLLGKALTKVDQQSFAAQLNQAFALCDMGSAFAPTMNQSVQSAANLVSGWQEDVNHQRSLLMSYWPPSRVASGGVVASADDLVAWSECLHTGKLGVSQTQLTQNSVTRDHRWGELNYGAGLQWTETKHGLEFSHSGYVPGYVSTMTHYPQKRLTLVVLENVSWTTADMTRAFAPHDKIREHLLALSID
ncbi:serine hydrolase domain-containing protein [Paraferrimonas sedimenticola]|uniref:Beta-lactamase-related domain-containing protein n=1 Tax=Paraferrimonas sedimenticola TaxID=375674 RepID=A0AA37RTP4_9GAMM|nr:serine hydrolase domain-containing protein [Paraferrimonas sedimenticola]GLP95119.1 hypothetical protein GCM10007895_04250 [Paraferrimonas sedimenticola]